MKKYGLLLICLLMGTFTIQAAEGMWPLSEIHKLNLAEKGFQIEPLDLYNPAGVSLIDAIGKLDGCTSSFVSADGMILTNYHCAFGAIQNASTPEKNLIQLGFLANQRSAEIPAKSFTLRITDSYRDVSEEILKIARENQEPGARKKAIEQKSKEIVLAAEQANPGKRAEISEMFTGKTYVLFIYTYLKDIRLVYAPPNAIGEFGGETDNWVWPRHTGDFAFMRAYVAPNGEPAEFAAENVPFRPKKYLQTNATGVNDGDFVFILGYPGRTFRHESSHFLAYEQNIRMPYVMHLYEWQITVMEKMRTNDPNAAIKLAGEIKSRANTAKNYRGKLLGLQRLELVDRKQAQEQALQQFIESDSLLRKEYGRVLEQIAKIYQEKSQMADLELGLDYLLRGCNLFHIAYTIYEAGLERAKPDLERESAYMERNFQRTQEGLLLRLKNNHPPADQTFLVEMLSRIRQLPAALIPTIQGQVPQGPALDSLLTIAYRESKLTQEAYLKEALSDAPGSADRSADFFMELARAFYPAYQNLKEIRRRQQGELDNLQASLTDVKIKFMAADFVPDANRTLRLTYGQVRGYSPSDAVYFQPITTLAGIVEKNTGAAPFAVPERLVELAQKRDFGAFRHPQLDDVPVAILYDMDTTGGNSGSPVLDARGNLVGLNFDRAFEATINDFAWSEHYSRSIGVDIRYILWVMQKLSGAEHLLKEMQVKF